MSISEVFIGKSREEGPTYPYVGKYNLEPSLLVLFTEKGKFGSPGIVVASPDIDSMHYEEVGKFKNHWVENSFIPVDATINFSKD